MATNTVLILGARGRLGGALVHAFARDGWRVLAHVRVPAATLPAAEVVTRPLAELAIANVGHVDVVVHAANPPYEDRAWRAQAPVLMDQAIAIARRQGALLMFPGNVYNFGASMPAELDEEAPQRPTTEKGRIRVNLEARLRAVRSVVLRAGDFFGVPGGYLDLMIARDLGKGRVTLPGDRDTPTAWAYVPDLAATFVAVARQHAALDGARVLHVGGHTLRGQDWVDALQATTGRRLSVHAFPWWAVRAAGIAVPRLAAMADMAYLWRTPHRLVNDRLVALIGAEPSTPLATAIARETEAKRPDP